MAETRIEHVHHCDVDTFWKIFLDASYQSALFRDGLGFPSFEQLKLEESERKIERVIRVIPKVVGVPGPLKALIGDGFNYEEHGTFDRAAKTFKFKIKTSRLSDKINMFGVIYCVPAGEGKSKRVFEATVQAKIFGVGGMLERQIIHDMERDYATGATFTNRYLKDHGLGSA